MDKLSFKVNIMDRDFTVACRDEERPQLLAAAAYLDDMMRSIQHSGRVIGHERCAIMAALNISNELLHGEGDDRSTPVLNQVPDVADNSAFVARIESMTERLDDELDLGD
ncbi:MAG: cell division protein ZapA [Parasphingorhabdus sp.]|jgi:cell division protein ZapA